MGYIKPIPVSSQQIGCTAGDRQYISLCRSLMHKPLLIIAVLQL